MNEKPTVLERTRALINHKPNQYNIKKRYAEDNEKDPFLLKKLLKKEFYIKLF